jgi:hypothetical protein
MSGLTQDGTLAASRAMPKFWRLLAAKDTEQICLIDPNTAIALVRVWREKKRKEGESALQSIVFNEKITLQSTKATGWNFITMAELKEASQQKPEKAKSAT